MPSALKAVQTVARGESAHSHVEMDVEKGVKEAELTSVLSHAARLLDPFRHHLHQLANAGWHGIDSLGVVEEEHLHTRQQSTCETTVFALTVP